MLVIIIFIYKDCEGNLWKRHILCILIIKITNVLIGQPQLNLVLHILDQRNHVHAAIIMIPGQSVSAIIFLINRRIIPYRT